jgi:competence protein ComGC
VSNSSIVRELWAYMRARKKLWLLPILVVLGIVSLLLVVAQGSALAPFIYSIF